MIEAARRRGLYHDLHAADVERWLAGAPAAQFDLILAADVFIYIGALETVFAEVAKVLRAEGVFAFSVESCAQGDWRLLSSGRYAQSPAYLARLAERHQWRIAQRVAVEIRRGVPGELYVLLRTAS
jgi:predicted TPR repeat methyltransferase